MNRRLKLVTSLTTLAAASALALAGCGGEGEGAEGEVGLGALDSEAGGEGESEGEAGSASGDPATDDAAYIHLLGLTRGHLIAFYELYRGGAHDVSMPHAKHPSSELYASLEPAFTARGQSGFADELTRLAETAASGGDIEEDYQRMVTAINAHMPRTNVATTLLGVAAIVRTAADEFKIGVSDEGAITNAHEYQDAFGFLNASRDILASIQANDVDETEAIAIAHEQIEAALASFDALTVEQTEGSASTLYGAAARIEIAARGLR